VIELIKRYWRTISTPSKYFSLGFLSLGGFMMGMIFWGGFNTAMEFTNSETFCVSCHQNIYQELQTTIHFTNRSGVRAICSSCHVPHDWTDKIARKMQASKEVFAWVIGTIDTPEKFEARRRYLAEREWHRLKANNSLECRNCHEFEYMDFTWQSSRAVYQHSTALASGEKTCIDCHKGIAHKLPDMSGVPGF
jgi:cytochrome c-type protein NapC